VGENWISGFLPATNPGGWDEIFAALDKAGFPEDFMADRDQGVPKSGLPATVNWATDL